MTDPIIIGVIIIAAMPIITASGTMALFFLDFVVMVGNGNS